MGVASSFFVSAIVGAAAQSDFVDTANVESMLSLDQWRGLCGCTPDSNLAARRGYYCSCDPSRFYSQKSFTRGGFSKAHLANMSARVQPLAKELCTRSGFEYEIVEACSASCSDPLCVGLIRNAILCWGAPYKVWSKRSLNPRAERCFHHVDGLHLFHGETKVSTDFDTDGRNRIPVLPWVVGRDGKGGVRRCEGKPAAIHHITWADGPHRAVQLGRRTAQACGFEHHLVTVPRNDPFTVGSVSDQWFTVALRRMQNITWQSPCDLFILTDAFDVFFLPTCDTLYPVFERLKKHFIQSHNSPHDSVFQPRF